MASMLINIDVPDLDPAERFYVEAFGLRPSRRFPGVVELGGGPCPIQLLHRQQGTATAGEARRYNRHWTPLHLDWMVEDLDAALSRAVAAGARIEAPAQTFVWGRIAMLADPFGHGFCLIQLLNRGYDELADPGSSDEFKPG